MQSSMEEKVLEILQSNYSEKHTLQTRPKDLQKQRCDLKENKKVRKKERKFFFLDRFLGRERVFFLLFLTVIVFLFFLIAFLVESVFFLFSYFLVFVL